MLALYNTLSHGKELFKSIKKKTVGLYSCGPTVYNFAHIGNLRTYIFVDLLKRVLAMDGYRVKHIMNITDVGHLTSDADSGEDKLEKGAARENRTVWAVAEFYTRAFKSDLKLLNIVPPSKYEKATANIKSQIALIKELEKKGFIYSSPIAVYFDTARDPNYGTFAGIKTNDQMEGAGARTTGDVQIDSQKKHPADFVLWFKRVGKYKDHAMHWPSPWGDGFPGWHIECSAISMKYLGETFDIHTGGIDHIGTHHVNEIAQSENATGKKFVNYWLHAAFLNVEGEAKMAKSGDNFITLKSVMDQGFSPLDYRYLTLTAHYRSSLSFSWENLKAAKTARANLMAQISRFKELAKTDKKASDGEKDLEKEYSLRFNDALDDDLNVPQALAILWEVIRDKGLSSKAKLRLIYGFDKVFGLDLDKIKPVKLTSEVKKLIEEREKLRAYKQFVKADLLRQRIEELGYRVEDTENGYIIYKI